jgi:hypothetical protein
MSPTKDKQGFSAEEKAAMRARAKELKMAAEGEEAITLAPRRWRRRTAPIGKRIHEPSSRRPHRT